MLFRKGRSNNKHLRKLRARETEANKPRLRRSLTSASGSLFIEAAIIFPILFFGLMCAIEIMNVYLQRGSVANVANSIAMAIQQNPDITAQKMYEFQKSLGGGVTPFKEVKISDGSPYTETTPCSVANCRVTGLDIRIGASTTPVKEPDIRNLDSSDWSSPHVGKLAGQANKAWPNAASPLQVDPNQSAADDANAYYVGVRVAWQNRPIFTTLGLGSFTTTQFGGVVVKPPVSMECPDGQMVKGFVGGVPSCGLQVGINQSCPAGQVVYGFSNGQALCVAVVTPSPTPAPKPDCSKYNPQVASPACNWADSLPSTETWAAVKKDGEWVCQLQSAWIAHWNVGKATCAGTTNPDGFVGDCQWWSNFSSVCSAKYGVGPTSASLTGFYQCTEETQQWNVQCHFLNGPTRKP